MRVDSVEVDRDDGVGVEMAYTDSGDRTAPQTLLLLHGIFDHKGTWSRVSPYLEEHFRVVAPDMVGCGESGKPEFRSLPENERYGLDMLTRQVREFIRQLHLQRVILVGSSLGGSIALRLACSAHRGHGFDLCGLVLVAAAGYRQRLPGHIGLLAGAPGALLTHSLMRQLALKTGVVSWLARAAFRRAFYDPSGIPSQLVDAAVEIFARPGAADAYRMAARNLIPPDADSFPKEYRDLRLPALIVWGKEDRIVPVLHALRFEADLQTAKLHVFDECGHAPHLEYPHETAVAIRDWARQVLT